MFAAACCLGLRPPALSAALGYDADARGIQVAFETVLVRIETELLALFDHVMLVHNHPLESASLPEDHVLHDDAVFHRDVVVDGDAAADDRVADLRLPDADTLGQDRVPDVRPQNLGGRA